MSVTFASHILNLLRQRAQQQPRCHAIEFCDLQAAFYRAQRSTVTDDALRFGLHCHDEDTSIAQVTEPAALTQLGVPANVQGWVQQILAQVWPKFVQRAMSTLDKHCCHRGAHALATLSPT